MTQGRDRVGRFLPVAQGASAKAPDNWVPNPQAPFQRSTANQVILALMSAFIVAAISDVDKHKRDDGSISLGSYGQALITQNLPAWAIVFGGLIILSDFQSSGNLAAAFAWLICIVTLLNKGPDAFKNLRKATTPEWLGSKKTDTGEDENATG